MILPVYGYGHPVLRKVSEEISSSYPQLEKLIEDMFETMYSSAGVGLAAPQIGLNIRLFIIDATPYKEEVGEQYPLKQIFINPIMVEEEGDFWSFEEGCLSIPDIREDVERLSRVTLEYMNEKFELTETTFDGIMARIIQHEYDHLEGKMFVDHLSSLKKMMLRRRLQDITKGNIQPGYKMKFSRG